MEETVVETKTGKKTKGSKDPNASLRAELAALKAKVAEGEEAALKRVCAHFKIDPADMVPPAKKDEKGQELFRLFVHFPIRMNAVVYQGMVEVPRDVAEVLQETMGKRRQRLLSELTGNTWQLKELAQGGSTTVLIGRVNDAGERIG